MSLVYCDSFDHYVTADLVDKYTTQLGTTSTISGSGRNGSGFASGASGTTYQGWRKSFGVSWQTWIVGCAFLVPSTPGTQVNCLRIEDGSTAQIEIRVNTDLTVSVTRNGTTLGTSATTLTTGDWAYIELKVKIDNTTGTVELKINGVTRIGPLTSQDTQNTGNASASALVVGSDRLSMRFDDLYVLNSTDSGVTGAPNNDFLGDVRVEALFPNGNGNYSQFLGSDANSTDNYLLVDETAPNDDTDYVESSAIGDKDTYTMTNLTTVVGTVYGVQTVPNAKKDDAGTRQFKSQLRSGGVDSEGAAQALSTSYAFYLDIFQADSSGNQWTISTINSVEAGVKVHA